MPVGGGRGMAAGSALSRYMMRLRFGVEAALYKAAFFRRQ